MEISPSSCNNFTGFNVSSPSSLFFLNDETDGRGSLSSNNLYAWNEV